MESGYYEDDNPSVDPLRVVASNVGPALGQQYKYDAGVDLSTKFHTYGAELNMATGDVDFYLDGVFRKHYDGGPTQPVFLLLNSHVANKNYDGGSISSWHTVPTSGSSASMQVYGVRVFERP